MRTLIRDRAITVVADALATKDQALLDSMYYSEVLQKSIGRETLLQLWHGYMSVDELSDVALVCLVDFLGTAEGECFEYTDYSYLYEEYLSSFANESVRYQTKQRLMKTVRVATMVYHKDLPEISRDEAYEIQDAMTEDSTPATVHRNILCAGRFCQWCIEQHKYPNAVNNFRNLGKVSHENWVKKHLVKDADALMNTLRLRVVFNDGRSGPVLVALAWMGFTQQEVLKIRNEDVDLIDKTVCGIKIPDVLMDVFLQYDTGSLGIPFGGGEVQWVQEDLGYYIKRHVCNPSGVPFDESALYYAVAGTGFVYNNIKMAGWFYAIYQFELGLGRELDTDEFILQLKKVSRMDIPFTTVKQRYLSIYRTYVSTFWANA